MKCSILSESFVTGNHFWSKNFVRKWLIWNHNKINSILPIIFQAQPTLLCVASNVGNSVDDLLAVIYVINNKISMLLSDFPVKKMHIFIHQTIKLFQIWIIFLFRPFHSRKQFLLIYSEFFYSLAMVVVMQRPKTNVHRDYEMLQWSQLVHVSLLMASQYCLTLYWCLSSVNGKKIIREIRWSIRRNYSQKRKKKKQYKTVTN